MLDRAVAFSWPPTRRPPKESDQGVRLVTASSASVTIVRIFKHVESIFVRTPRQMTEYVAGPGVTTTVRMNETDNQHGGASKYFRKPPALPVDDPLLRSIEFRPGAVIPDRELRIVCVSTQAVHLDTPTI